MKEMMDDEATRETDEYAVVGDKTLHTNWVGEKRRRNVYISLTQQQPAMHVEKVRRAELDQK
jgi:hypothetical protein